MLPTLAQEATPSVCAYCGLPSQPGQRFCCPGCAAAFETIQHLGLGSYYKERLLDPSARAPRPEQSDRLAFGRFITTDAQGRHTLNLAVDGLQCGACVWLIEQILSRTPGLSEGRVNMTTRRLRLVWSGPIEDATGFVDAVEALGYRLVPYDATQMAASRDRTGAALMRALAVAGFAAGNVMLISIAIWAGVFQGMGPATRDLFHWVSALIALPAIAYAGRPFFTSAIAALRQGRSNMDVPISIGVILVSSMSLVETLRSGENTYFDSAISLVFFLLIGRVLDHRARAQARASAEQLLALQQGDVTVIDSTGTSRRLAAGHVEPGWQILVGMGERVGVDGEVVTGQSSLDASLITGESLPVAAGPGSIVYAGTINLGEAITVRATRTGEATLLADCVRLIEAAEARRSRFVVLADRVARRYAPVVHICAALTFLYWWLIAGAPIEQSLLTAAAVLIITCPCALALAVPAVQVIATGRLLRAGILLKSATALERLAEVDTVVFDKTGTLTQPSFALVNATEVQAADLRVAAGLAAASRHPLARALVAASGPVVIAAGVVEVAGQGLKLATPHGEIRLGSRPFAGDPAAPPALGPEIWLHRSATLPICFRFGEQLRPDANRVVRALEALGLRVRLLSGDQPEAVARTAASLALQQWEGACTPVTKVSRIEAMKQQGSHVLMVGDGLNDGPSLAAAQISMSPATGADISQNVADVVFQGERLAPVLAVLRMARRTRMLMRQNIGLSLGYNLVMVPLAITGQVTPWLAAAAMSCSSLIVLANSFRARGGKDLAWP